MGSIILILFGIINLIIWALMKSYSAIRATLIKRIFIMEDKYHIRRTFLMEYIFKNKVYRKAISAKKNCDLYNGTERREI